MIDAGETSAELVAAVAAVERQFIAEPESKEAFAQALKWLVDVTDSESGFVVELLPSDSAEHDNTTFELHASHGVQWDESSHVFYDSSGKDRRSLPGLSQLPVEVMRSLHVVIHGPVDQDQDDVRTATSSTQAEPVCGFPLFDDGGGLVGVLGIANRRNGYEVEFAARWQPMCEALGIMIAGARRERERCAAEAALRISEVRHRIFADHVTDGLFLQDAESRVVDVNRRGCESLGYERDELIGMTPRDFDSAITPAEIIEYSARLANGESITFDSRHRRKDGSEFPVEIRIRPVWIEGKLHTLALVCDITERKRAEAKLFESEQRLQLALKASRMGVWEWDIATDTVFLSPECREIYGEMEFNGTGKAFNKLIHPDDFRTIGEKVVPLLEKDTFGSWEFRFFSADRGTLWIANWAVVRRDATGKAIKLTGTTRDITEQKLAEEALRQSTLLLENVVENIPLAVFVKDPQELFRIRLWNKGAETIFGIPREEIIGRTSHDFWPRQHAEAHELIDRLVIDESTAQEIAEDSSFHRNGEPMILHTRKLPLFDSQGKPTLLLAICDDITERRRSDEALHQAQQRLEIALRGGDVGLWDWDLVTDEVIFSEEWKSQLGYSGDEIRNHESEWESRVHPDDFAQAKENIRVAIEVRRGEYRSEFRMQHKDGSWRWILSRGSVIDDANGKPIRMLGVHIDITDRKRTEQALRESEARLRTLLENLDKVAVQAYEPEGTITFWNRASELFYGYTASEAIGQDLVSLLHADHTRDMERRIMAEALRTGKPPGAEEVEVVRRDGSKITVFASRVVHPRPGKQSEFFCFDVDITDRKRAEEELARRQNELLHASRLSTVGQMVAEISHEVAQPLNAIGNFAAASARILETGIDGQLDSLHEYVRAILTQNERCVAILDRLRDFSRRAPGKPVPCDVARLLHESVELVSHDLRRNRVDVRFELADTMPPVVGDRIQLQQLIVNLLTNARDAMQEQPQSRRVITVAACAEDSYVVLEVMDRGTGLSDDAAIHLFDPFFTTKDHGMGIGLSICQSIVKDHGGRIEAYTNQEGGATFCVRLPLSGKRRS